MQFHEFGVQSATKNELFMIIKLDLSRKRFCHLIKYYCIFEISQSVSLNF